MKNNLSRRNFLSQGCTSLSAVWVSTHIPAMLSAARHARESVQSPAPKLTFFTPEQAVEIDAITCRIIPTDGTPGAHEAGVVYFIDRALTTFAADNQQTYRDGLAGLQSRVHELFPAVEKFSRATPDQQDKILHSFDEQGAGGGRVFRSEASASSFFEAVRLHTIIGFLIDPDAGRGGNRDGVGWKLIGRDRDHMFQPPFGHYDKDYAGWQPNPPVTEKTKA